MMVGVYNLFSGLARAKSLFIVALLTSPLAASAAPANTSSIGDIPDASVNYGVFLYLSISRDQTSSVYQYRAAPLTAEAGMGDPNAWRGINIQGNVVPVNASNYQTFEANHTVAFVSCDWAVPGNATTNSTSPPAPITNPDTILNTVMTKRPQAIILYSFVETGCSLTGDELNYTSVWTMASAEQAKFAVQATNSTDGYVALLSGRDMAPGGGGAGGSNGGVPASNNNSNVAMSILYSITGLITALFLVIITTGAVRAHRNPERYGPRAAVAGRGRQSRAKGIARAVLETLPIVKFGDPKPAKSDHEMEIDTLPGDRQHSVIAGNEASSSHTRPSTDRRTDTQAVTSNTNQPESRETSTPAAAAAPSNLGGSGQVGCSICTEDFTVGEDVRVLPCDHNFHPACIDPWLVNVSGTCPLCRLDLRPPESAGTEESHPETADGSSSAEPSSTNQGPVVAVEDSRSNRRVSRLLHPGRQRSEHVEPSTVVENRQSRVPSEAPEHDQRRMERILHVFRIRTRRQGQAPSSVTTTTTPQ